MDKIIHKDQFIDLSNVDEHYNRIERKKYVKLQKEVKELRKKLKQYEEEEKEDDDSNENEGEEEDDNDDENSKEEEEGEQNGGN